MNSLVALTHTFRCVLLADQRYNMKLRFAFLLGAFLLFASHVAGQTLAGQGAINGTVLDSSGAVVPSAVVTVSNRSIGIERKLTASQAGEFLASSLPPADGYTVSVQKSGFALYEVQNVSVHVGQVVTVPIRLSVS